MYIYYGTTIQDQPSAHGELLARSMYVHIYLRT